MRELEKKIYELSKPKQLHTYQTETGPQFGVLTQNIMDFETLCFSMYKADGGVKVSELKRMNCIEFYTHKTRLIEYIRRNRPKEKE